MTKPAGDAYELLPFRFARLSAERVVLTNMAGQHLVADRSDVDRLANRQIRPTEALYKELKARHFLYDQTTDVALEMLAAQVRTRLAAVKEFTGLHMFVVTLRCDSKCLYCHASHAGHHDGGRDMDADVCEEAVNAMLQTPNPSVKVEFQGGEPLLNFEAIKHIVAATEAKRGDKDADYIVTSNLYNLTSEHLQFFADHDVGVSTSLDGPADLHNANRPRGTADAYARVIRGIEDCREAIGPRGVSALMTTTRQSLARGKDIVDEYVRQGFHSIFLRPLNPFGLARTSWDEIGYSAEDFVEFYKTTLDYIIDVNRRGFPIMEHYASIILRKMLTCKPCGYVDLASPAAIGIGGIIYNYDGRVFASDEGRMLAACGDNRFLMGDLRTDTYDELFTKGDLLEVIWRTMCEGVPGCCDCAFQPWCGSAPVFHYATQGDIIGHKPTSEFCRRNMAIMTHLVELMEASAETRQLFERWAQA